ncbi:RNA polymerase sigma-70 factor [Pseudalkalibacillus sp. R45]|uniref:RNA polymerase sigma-70 factor n=1 Tax=Pseudalkalibacillus sp. R45 TaxID=3457433 RepID=UPI003FCE26A5
MNEIEQLYQDYKPLLFSLAYRMLGSVMDAEDIVQDTFIKFEKLPNRGSITNVKSYLCKMTTNRCIDQLRSSVHQKETYVGPWLPEPIVEDYVADPAGSYFMKESISTAYMLLLEQLSEVERAVFLLREVFQYEYDEIADIVDKSSTNCRQIFHRAKKSLGHEPESFQKDSKQLGNIVETFLSALNTGNISEMLQVLAKDATFYSDGGGKVKAAVKPIYTAERITQFFFGIMQKFPADYVFHRKLINGVPGVVVTLEGQVLNVVSFTFEEEKINDIYLVANPDKLRSLNEHIQLK